MRIPAAVFLLLSAAALPAQQAAQQAALPPAEPHGTVIVHVSCADTNQPARFANVTLQPVGEQIPEPFAAYREARPASPAPKTPVVTTFKTGLDGSVTLSDVAPGRYYVAVQYPGYASLMAQFSREELNHPDDATRALMDKTIPVVAVAAQQISPVEVRLVHAAVVTGTIRFDDGAPTTDTSVVLERRGSKGDWVSAGPNQYVKTDDQGRYRISSLAAGEFRLHVILQLSNSVGGTIFGGFTYSTSFYSLTFYSGDTLRPSAAKTFKLTEGENSSGNDITIPASRLHSITGSLTDARTGAALNHGHIYLVFPDGDGKERAAVVMVDPDLRTFHFPYVLDGEYQLEVHAPSEVSRKQLPATPTTSSFVPPPRFDERLLQSYEDYSAPFTLHNDAAGVTLPLTPAKPTKPKP